MPRIPQDSPPVPRQTSAPHSSRGCGPTPHKTPGSTPSTHSFSWALVDDVHSSSQKAIPSSEQTIILKPPNSLPLKYRFSNAATKGPSQVQGTHTQTDNNQPFGDSLLTETSLLKTPACNKRQKIKPATASSAICRSQRATSQAATNN